MKATAKDVIDFVQDVRDTAKERLIHCSEEFDEIPDTDEEARERCSWRLNEIETRFFEIDVLLHEIKNRFPEV